MGFHLQHALLGWNATVGMGAIGQTAQIDWVVWSFHHYKLFSLCLKVIRQKSMFFPSYVNLVKQMTNSGCIPRRSLLLY